MSELVTGSTLFEPTSPDDRRLAQRAPEGLLREANQAGAITAADVHTAVRVGRLAGEEGEPVLLALALAVHAVVSGSTCLDLGAAVDPRVEIDWPEPAGWLEQVQDSPLVATGVLRVEHGLIYLDRYHEQEVQVARDLEQRLQATAETHDESLLATGLERLFPPVGDAAGDGGDGRHDPVEQRAAARVAVTRGTTVLTGGPGTGKTTTVARLLALLVEQAEQRPGGHRLRIALCAPTARAAAQLRDAVTRAAADMSAADQARIEGLEALTMHRLLGWKPGSSNRFRHDRRNRLPHDVVVVDEASMVSLTLMARLLEALRPETRLVVVGDPDQLASVDAGAVLADLVAGLRGRADDGVAVEGAAGDEVEVEATGGDGVRPGLGPPVVRLTHTYRFGGGIGDLAQAIRDGDADRALAVLADADDVDLVADPDDVRHRLVRQAVDLRRRAAAGDGEGALRALAGHRLLCAHRTGPFGVSAWNRLVEQWVSEETGETFWTPMYPGRPLLVTSNDYANDLLNGDTGVVIRSVDGVLRAELETTGGRRLLPTSRLSDIETMHAMTVHKAQGSQAEHVTVLLPELDSPLLTRELLYTGVTRAQRHVTVVGTPEVLRAAIARRTHRASGLAQRLGAADGGGDTGVPA
ncbi:exodeoxyribonuclease V subunit alpha [Barrientosiimonas humi]|uniref:exodeoxyribonuclease V subunit alpha n=1 Tax=Barrientosiimonas humi TaxID=999931 RepID=UPI00370D929F